MLYHKGLPCAAAVGWMVAALAGSASAKPEYARKEGVACLHCHVNGNPGSLDRVTGARQSTERNVRGAYYGSHNHTFAGYVEAAVRPVSVAPTFHYVWK